jgi:large subunit ribosomal protein L4
MKANVYNQKGAITKTVDIPETVFGLPWNGDLVHQVSVALQANARPTVADTKGRGEVRGGGKKPWRQKGTGRARHGSRRSPIWIGGGVAHGPTSEKDYSQKVNKKMRTKALFTVLSEKFRKNQVLFVDQITFDAMKTKSALEVMHALASIEGVTRLETKRKNSGLLALPGRSVSLEKSFANLPQVEVAQVKDLNVVTALSHKYVIIVSPEEAVAFFEGKQK